MNRRFVSASSALVAALLAAPVLGGCTRLATAPDALHAAPADGPSPDQEAPPPSTPAPAAPEAAIITGRVTGPTGQPEAAVLIRIESVNVGASTAADGSYRLVVPGQRFSEGQAVQVTASRVGLTPATHAVTLRHAARLTQDVRISPSRLVEAFCGVTGVVPANP